MALTIEANFSPALKWRQSIDELDYFKDTTHLINMTMNKIKKNIEGSEAVFYIWDWKNRKFYNFYKPNTESIPEEAVFCNYLVLKNKTIYYKDIRDRQIYNASKELEDMINSIFFPENNEYHFFVPIAYHFKLFGFIAIKLVKRQIKKLSLEEEVFLFNLRRSLSTNLFLAILSDQRISELIALDNLTHSIDRFNSYEDLMKNILNLVYNMIPFDVGIYYEYDNISKILKPKYKINIEDAPYLSIGESISGIVFDKKKPLLLYRITENKFFYKENKEKFLKLSILSIPFATKNKSFGVLTIGRNKRHQEFTVDQLYLLKNVGKFLLDMMENKHIYMDLENSYLETIFALVKALEAKDKYTGGHSERVMGFAVGIGEELGLSNEEIKHLRFGSLLHDIGKIGIPAEIIGKTGKLTQEEFDDIKEHVEIGYNILSTVDFLSEARKYVLYHHEKLDGSGYLKKKADEFPWEATIVAISDIFDALTTDRPYRKGSNPTEAMTMMKENIGRDFDKKVYNAFVRFLKKAGMIESDFAEVD